MNPNITHQLAQRRVAKLRREAAQRRPLAKASPPECPHPPGETPSPRPVKHDLGIVERWRTHRAERRLEQLLRLRTRRALVRALRRTARDATHRNRTHRALDVGPTARWCWTPTLHYRAAAVRTALLEIAALLEQASDPDPALVDEIRELLTDGNSPLYHRSVHVSELYATLYYIRAGLQRDHAPRPTPRPAL